MSRRFDLWLVLSVVLLGGFAALGIWNGIGDLSGATTRLQLLTSIAQLAYGILALVALPALLIGWRGLRLVLQLWVVAVTVTGGLAPVAWGGATVGAGIAALILSCVIALGIIWVVRRAQVAP